ncbi:unnamed protein product [Prunus armeniaca]
MSDMRRCLERQDREIKERRGRRVEEKRVQQEEDEAIAIAVGLLEQSSQGHNHCSQVGRGPNVDRHKHSWDKNLLEDYFIPNYVYDDVKF